MISTLSQSQNTRTDRQKNSLLISGVAIFLFALLIRLWFNFLSPHVNNISIGDAGGYLNEARSIDLAIQYWFAYMHFASHASFVSLFLVLKTLPGAMSNLPLLTLTGPTYPLFLYACYALIGSPIGQDAWYMPVIVQCLISALTCVFIFLTGVKLWNKRVGQIAGVLSAIYPGFIISSGILFTETLACYLLAIVFWLAVEQITTPKSSVTENLLLGFLSNLLQLTRSMMLFVAITILPLSLFSKRGKQLLISIISIFTGLTLSMAPWLFWQHARLNQCKPFVDRVGTINYYIGNNTDFQGWISEPPPEEPRLYQASYSTLTVEAYQKNPHMWWSLQLDKPVRLFKSVWNDYRVCIGALQPQHLLLIHQLILLFGYIGICTALFTETEDQKHSTNRIAGRWILLITVLVHLPYAVFAPVPRYNITAMPSLILFAAAALYALAHTFQRHKKIFLTIALSVSSIVCIYILKYDLLKSLVAMLGEQYLWPSLILVMLTRSLVFIALAFYLYKFITYLQGNHKAARCITVILTIVILPFLSITTRAHGRWYGWIYQLNKPGDQITQTIIVPSTLSMSKSHSQVYLVIDADHAYDLMNDLQISINNHPLDLPIIPGIALTDFTEKLFRLGPYHYTDVIFDVLSQACGTDSLHVRQWYFIPVPPDLLKTSSSPVQITLKKNTGLMTRLHGSLCSKWGRLEMPSLTMYSFGKAFYGVGNSKGITDPRMDTKISLPIASQLASRQSTGKFGDPLVRLLVSRPSDNFQPMHAITNEPINVPDLETQHGQFSTAIKTVPDFRKQPLWLLRLRGKVHSASPAHPGIDINFTALDKDHHTFIHNTPWAPKIMNTTDTWQKFDIAIPFASSLFPHGMQKIGIDFYAKSPVLALTNRPIAESTTVRFKDVVVQIMSLPQNPLSLGYKIY